MSSSTTDQEPIEGAQPGAVKVSTLSRRVGMAAAIGFAFIIFASFMNFTPVVDKNWLTGGVGIPVMFSCVLGMVLSLHRKFFAAFFIGIFAAFFVTHEIIIVYDNHAVELGMEASAQGWFRSVIQLFADALRPGYGAFWGFLGSLIATLLTLLGMATEVWHKNQLAAADEDSFWDDETDKVDTLSDASPKS